MKMNKQNCAKCEKYMKIKGKTEIGNVYFCYPQKKFNNPNLNIHTFSCRDFQEQNPISQFLRGML